MEPISQIVQKRLGHLSGSWLMTRAIPKKGELCSVLVETIVLKYISKRTSDTFSPQWSKILDSCLLQLSKRARNLCACAMGICLIVCVCVCVCVCVIYKKNHRGGEWGPTPVGRTPLPCFVSPNIIFYIFPGLTFNPFGTNVFSAFIQKTSSFCSSRRVSSLVALRRWSIGCTLRSEIE